MSKYELEERTLNFSIKLISELRAIPKDLFNIKLIDQLIKSGTSIGANYVEANGAESRKDFIHKIRIAYKEAREARYWLTVISKTNPEFESSFRELWKETDEYVRMFSSIISTSTKFEN